MKKVLFVVLVLSFLFSFSGLCVAASLDDFVFGGHAGILMPQGDLDDAGADMGFVLGGHGMIESDLMDGLLFGGSIGYEMCDGDYNLEYSGIQVLGFARKVFADSNDIRFFGQLGAGFLMWEVEYEYSYYGYTHKVEDDGTDFGFSLGGGLEFMENFEATVLYNTFDEAEYFTLTVGYNFK